MRLRKYGSKQCIGTTFISLISGILLEELSKTTKYLRTSGLLIEILNLGPSKHRNVTDLTTTLDASVEMGVGVLLSIFGRCYCHF
jgi:hypothetical protein